MYQQPMHENIRRVKCISRDLVLNVSKHLTLFCTKNRRSRRLAFVLDMLQSHFFSLSHLIGNEKKTINTRSLIYSENCAENG